MRARLRFGPRRAASLGITLALLAVGGGLLADRSTRAADHVDPPARTNIGTLSDTAADIADLYLEGTNSTIKVSLTFAGPKEAGVPATYDRDVLYRVHLSNDADPTTDEAVIDVRFGKDAAGNWGVQFTGVPGSTGPVVVPVQTVTRQGVVTAVAGLFDDPFYFDQQGFNDTKATGVLSIKNTRNIFAGKNDTAFVIEFPRSAFEPTNHTISAWAETRRITAGAAS